MSNTASFTISICVGLSIVESLVRSIKAAIKASSKYILARSIETYSGTGAGSFNIIKSRPDPFFFISLPILQSALFVLVIIIYI